MKIIKFTCLTLLVIIINVGCNQSEPKSTKTDKVTPKKEQIKAPIPQKTESSKLDKYGRSPGHPHYGHNHVGNNHPTQQTDSTQKPAEGKPDKYGRKPGHPHYGHNHK